MKMKFCVYIVVFGIYAINSAWCLPPVIRTNPSDFLPNQKGNLVVEAGKGFTLECQGKKSVNWTSYPMYDADETSVIDIGSKHKNNLEVFLRVNVSNFRDTGYYYCSTADAKGIDDVANVQRVYIYVQDKNHLMLEEDEGPFQTVIQYSTHVVSCRPSSPDVTMSLIVDGERIDSGYTRQYGDNLKISYDPRIGFKLEHINLKDSNTYFCSATGFGLEEQKYVIIQVLPFTDTMPTPSINGSAERLFGVEGKKVTLECSVIINSEVIFIITWIVPDPTAIELKKITVHNTTNFGTVSSGSNPMKQVVRLLTIQNATVKDSGNYKCEVRDHNNNYNAAQKYLHISGSDDKYINMTTDTEIISVRSKIEKVQWVIKIASHPPANLTWISPDGKVLNAITHLTGATGIKYEQVSERDNEVILRIFKVALNDAGVYQLKAKNKHLEKILNLKLVVEESPKVSLAEGPAYYTKDKTWDLICDVTGHPRPKITWKFSPCDNPPNCTVNFKLADRTPSEEVVSLRNSQYKSTLLLKAARSRYISCLAENDLGSMERRMTFWVSDVGETGSEVKVTAPVGAGNKDIIAQDNVTLECGFSKYNYTDSLVWNFRPDKNSSRKLNLDNTHPQETVFSYKSNLIINNITDDYTGDYTCTANDSRGIPTSENIYIFVQAQEPPTIESENMNDTEYLVKEGAITKLICNVNGRPKPTIIWLKDDQPLIMVKDNITLYNVNEDNTTLEITYSPSNIEGAYTCVVSNRAGTVKRSTQIKIENRSSSSTSKLVLGAFLVLVMISICVIAYLVIKIRKEKKLREELKAIGLEQFDKGAMDSINPDLPIDDQAELLPYDRKWEFPREKLKLGKQLGAGAFGVVMKAEAIGICEGEAISMVAVKMVKRNADHTYIKALASELKIMVHLGKHLNVVNLLGACTKNLNKRELLVIVEYCRFGNLHNYLLRHRADFIDQVDQITGVIDPNFGADIIARHDSMVMKSRMKYAGLSFSRSRSDSESSGCSPTNSGTVNSEAALISMTPTGGEEGCMLSNNSIQPEWRSNYRGDYKGHVRPICTRDVLCWAFQVARGMDYLAGRKVMHGDLAARNILLADDNVVKICDFGLAKSMYKSDNYKKKGDGPLPIKWMAVESISDRVFSTQSDVWSYGIVLWEFFSLAKTPYPGMEADEKLYQKLIGGYRMDKPEYATNAIYEVMKNCWLPRPVDRPTFGDLSEILGSMLEDNVKMHYMDLNDPYMNMNNIQWTMGQQSDYLAMMTAPTYDNMVAPGAECNEEELHQYVNGGIPSSPLTLDPEEGEASGYLCMSPALKQGAIFSPRATDTNNSFNFSPKPRLSRDESGNPFEKSHLLSNDTNYQSPSKSPLAVNNLNKEPTDGKPQGWEQKSNLMPSFSNPSYQILGAAIAPTADNYVNMPQHKPLDLDETDRSSYSNYVPMAKPSAGNFNQMAFTKSKDGEGFVHLPNNDLSRTASGIETQREENPYVN